MAGATGTSGGAVQLAWLTLREKVRSEGDGCVGVEALSALGLFLFTTKGELGVCGILDMLAPEAVSDGGGRKWEEVIRRGIEECDSRFDIVGARQDPSRVYKWSTVSTDSPSMSCRCSQDALVVVAVA